MILPLCGPSLEGYGLFVIRYSIPDKTKICWLEGSITEGEKTQIWKQTLGMHPIGF